MKIFQIITSTDMGGAERVAINIAKSKSPDFQYIVFEVVKGDSEFSKALKEDLRKNRIQFYCSPFKDKKTAICLFWIWFIWKYLFIRPAIIHSHTEIPDLSLWVFRKIAWIFFWIKPKYIRTIHNTELWNNWKGIGKIVEHYYKRHHSNIAISSSTQDYYVKAYGGEKLPIIFNGIEEVPQKTFPYLKKQKINILFAGRFEYQKGINELIAVILALKNDDRFFFHIIGNGSMKEKLTNITRQLPNVNMYEKIYGLSAYLGSFDYLFMPSNHEGLALMPIEASLAHTPTIINNCPGLKDTLPDNWTLKVTDNSVEGYIKLFSRLDTQNYTGLANSAYNFAKENFSITKMQNKYEEYYKKYATKLQLVKKQDY